MTLTSSSYQNNIEVTLNFLEFQAFENLSSIPDQPTLDRLKSVFLFITDLSSAQFEKYKNILISLYEISGNTAPADLITATPLFLEERVSPLKEPPPSKLSCTGNTTSK